MPLRDRHSSGSQICGGSRRRHFMAAVKFPRVIAVVSLILEVGRRALPRESHFVFGHPSV